PADVADFGELGGLDLDERRICEFGQAPGDFGLSDTGGADHEDVLRHHFFAQLLVELLPAPPVPERDRDRPLRLALSDDVTVEFGYDLAWREIAHAIIRDWGYRLRPAGHATGGSRRATPVCCNGLSKRRRTLVQP